MEKHYYRGYINIKNNLLEKVIIEVGIGSQSFVKVYFVNNEYSGISYTDDQNAYLITECYSQDSISEFNCCLLFDSRINSTEYLIGIWSKTFYPNVGESSNGRILIQYVRDYQKSEMLPEYMDLTNNSLGDYINDLSIINGIRKYFPIKEGISFSNENTSLIYKNIEELGIDLTREIKKIKVYQDQITQDLEELKAKLYSNKDINSNLIDLKFQVAKGDIKEVLALLYDSVKNNKSIINDYIMINANYSELQQQNFLSTIAREDYKIEMNTITKSILDLIDRILDTDEK